MSAVPVILARLVLAAVFVVAGLTKLVDRRGTTQAAIDFGAPVRIAGALSWIIPLAELTVACLLLPSETAVYGAICALALLLVFTAAIAWNLARGATPDCRCFGQLHSEPTSWKTLVRNGVLLLVAAVALLGTVGGKPTSATAWMSKLDGAELVALTVGAAALVLLGVGGVAFLTLMRSYGQVLTRLERVEAALTVRGVGLETDRHEHPEVGLEPGAPAPSFSATTTEDATATLETFTATGLPTLLLFTSPRCDSCIELLPTAAAWQRDYAERLNVVFASDGSLDELRSEAAEFELERVLVDNRLELYDAFLANGTPSAVIVSPEGTIASWVAAGIDQVEHLVESALASEDVDDEGLPVGAKAPELTLASLQGEEVSLGSLQGRASLLLFWNPDCGFCRSMHRDLVAWENSANGVTPRLVVVSSGDAESTRSEGFQSLVLLDESFSAGPAFKANGTPMAVLIDAEGRVASPTVAGAEAVLALARQQTES